MKQVSGSFRDNSGYVFDDGNCIIRTINEVFKEHWTCGIESGFLYKLVEKRLLLPFNERTPYNGSWKSITIEKLPFISYPYEWCFSQLKDAALMTIELQKDALKGGMILKDASAYNIQFYRASPIFIDHLSFERWQEGEPWKAYRQFCSHFLSPLSLISMVDLNCSLLSRIWIDGVPLEFTSKLLPLKSKFMFGLLWHLHLHAKMQKKHSNTKLSKSNKKNIKVSKTTLIGIATSLEKAIKKLNFPKSKTEWENYYENTNYSDTATEEKLKIVDLIASKIRNSCKHEIAVDLGANTGRYSKCLARYFNNVISPDIDPAAVERHYLEIKKMNTKNIIPLIIDLSNISPSIGWASSERDSFIERCKANMVAALALIHHLVITAGIPLVNVAKFFSKIMLSGSHLLIEFIPKEDSQVKLMLSSREDVFYDYTYESFKKAFSMYFTFEESYPIHGTQRTICLFRKL